MAIDIEELDKRRARLLEGMQEVMGPLPGEERLAPLALEVHATEELPHFTHRLISFATEPSDRVGAYLVLPRKPRSRICLYRPLDLTKGWKAAANVYSQ